MAPKGVVGVIMESERPRGGGETQIDEIVGGGLFRSTQDPSHTQKQLEHLLEEGDPLNSFGADPC